MAALFAFAAILQINDPDPLRWILVYTAASLISFLAAAGRTPSPLAPGLVALAAFTWAAAVLVDGPGLSDYLRMFDAWEMRSEGIEEAREASGLLIAGAWMAVIAASSR